MILVRRIALAICFLLLGINTIQAQLEDGESLEQQFDDMLKQSNRYQDFKVVKIVKLNRFHQNVQDSLDLFRVTSKADNSLIASQQQAMDSLNLSNSKLQSDLSQSQAKEAGISFFGALMQKGTYKTMMWVIIGILLLALIAVIMGYKNRASVTRGLSVKLSEIESEFEEHRQRALEREQQIRRKLQDEINKNKTES